MAGATRAPSAGSRPARSCRTRKASRTRKSAIDPPITGHGLGTWGATRVVWPSVITVLSLVLMLVLAAGATCRAAPAGVGAHRSAAPGGGSRRGAPPAGATAAARMRPSAAGAGADHGATAAAAAGAAPRGDTARRSAARAPTARSRPDAGAGAGRRREGGRAALACTAGAVGMTGPAGLDVTRDVGDAPLDLGPDLDRSGGRGGRILAGGGGVAAEGAEAEKADGRRDGGRRESWHGPIVRGRVPSA